MQKYGDVEKIDVLRGEEAQVLNKHMEKTGRYSVSDFNKTQREEFLKDLESARERMEGEGGTSGSDRTDDANERPSDQDS